MVSGKLPVKLADTWYHLTYCLSNYMSAEDEDERASWLKGATIFASVVDEFFLSSVQKQILQAARRIARLSADLKNAEHAFFELYFIEGCERGFLPKIFEHPLVKKVMDDLGYFPLDGEEEEA